MQANKSLMDNLKDLLLQGNRLNRARQMTFKGLNALITSKPSFTQPYKSKPVQFFKTQDKDLIKEWFNGKLNII